MPETLPITKTPSGCWIWTGRHDAYERPIQSIKGKVYRVQHRYYELHHGLKPERLIATCGNKSCVNPTHLQDTKHYNILSRATTQLALLAPEIDKLRSFLAAEGLSLETRLQFEIELTQLELRQAHLTALITATKEKQVRRQPQPDTASDATGFGVKQDDPNPHDDSTNPSEGGALPPKDHHPR